MSACRAAARSRSGSSATTRQDTAAPSPARVRDGERVVLVTAIDGVPEPGATLLVTADEEPDGSLGDPALDAAALELAHDALWTERCGLVDTGHGRVFLDAVAPPPRLFIFGAVDLAGHLAALASADGLARVRHRPAHGSSPPRRASPPPST